MVRLGEVFGQDAPVPTPVQAADVGVQAGARPGQFIFQGSAYDIGNWTEGWLFDTEILPTTVTGTTSYRFFTNRNFQATGAVKNERWTNMVLQNELPAGWKMLVTGIQFLVFPVPGVTAEDVQTIMTGGIANLRTNNQRDERDGPLLFFQSEMGFGGVVEYNGPGFHEFSVPMNGVPVKRRPDAVRLELYDGITFEAIARFPDGLTLDQAEFLMCILPGFIYKPVR